MTVANKAEAPEFICKGLEVHFIYSFTLSDTDGSRVTARDVRRAKGWDKIKIPDKRTGITPHLAVAPRFATVDDYEPIDLRIGDHSVQVTRLLRVFEAGATFTVCMEIPRDAERTITCDDILAAHRQVRVLVRPVAWLEESTEPQPHESVYGMFKAAVEKLCRETGFRWTDVAEGYLFDGLEEPQSPWVVTVAEVDGEVQRAFCSGFEDAVSPSRAKTEAVRPYRRQLAPILFRSVSEEFDLEPTYAPERALENLNVDARLFVSMSRRSVLCICADREQDPALYFLPDLLNICEGLRARWHSLILLNVAMDKTISDLIAEKKAAEGRPEGLLQRIVMQREWLASALQNPGIYYIAGDALSKIYNELEETFRLSQFMNMVLQKSELINKIYDDILQLDWQEARPERL